MSDRNRFFWSFGANLRLFGAPREEKNISKYEKIREQVVRISSISKLLSQRKTSKKCWTTFEIQYAINKNSLIVEPKQISGRLEPYMQNQTTYNLSTLVKLAKNSSVLKCRSQRKLSKCSGTATKYIGL